MGKGGYTIIDLKKKEIILGGEHIQIDGIFKQCEKAVKTSKKVVLTNVNIKNDDNLDYTTNAIESTLYFSEEVHAYMLEFVFYGVVCDIIVNYNDDIQLTAN